MKKHCVFACVVVAAALSACAHHKPPARPPVAPSVQLPEVFGSPPVFALRAHSEYPIDEAADYASDICSDFDMIATLRQTDRCPSFLIGEYIPDCRLMTFTCVEE